MQCILPSVQYIYIYEIKILLLVLMYFGISVFMLSLLYWDISCFTVVIKIYDFAAIMFEYNMEWKKEGGYTHNSYYSKHI